MGEPVEFHLLVDRNLSVDRAHDLSHQVSARIEQRFGGASVTIHIEPCDGRCTPECLSGCLPDESERDAMRPSGG